MAIATRRTRLLGVSLLILIAGVVLSLGWVIWEPSLASTNVSLSLGAFAGTLGPMLIAVSAIGWLLAEFSKPVSPADSLNRASDPAESWPFEETGDQPPG